MMPELIGYIEDINKGKTDKIIPDGVYYRNKNKIIGRGYRRVFHPRKGGGQKKYGLFQKDCHIQMCIRARIKT